MWMGLNTERYGGMIKVREKTRDIVNAPLK